jgi:hypothetical protein
MTRGRGEKPIGRKTIDGGDGGREHQSSVLGQIRDVFFVYENFRTVEVHQKKTAISICDYQPNLLFNKEKLTKGNFFSFLT